jgi:hypothetical protein
MQPPQFIRRENCFILRSFSLVLLARRISFYVYFRSATDCHDNGQRAEIRILKTMLGETP